MRRFPRTVRNGILTATLCGLAAFSGQPAFAQGSPPPPSFSAPPIKRFPEDIARNFAGLWSGDNLVPLVVGAAATGGAAAADSSVRDYFEAADRWDGFDPIGRRFGASQVLGPIIGVSFLTSRFTKHDRYQRFTYDLAQGFVAANVLTASIKVAVGRGRPDQASQYSFPSGHTSNSFMSATVVSRSYGWKAGVPAYAFASYVGTSRLKSRKHFLSDVVAGATLGYIVGRTVTRRSRNQERRLTWGLGVPDGGGVALNIGIRP